MTFQQSGRSVFVAVAMLCLSIAAFAQVPSSQHVVLIIDENTSYSAVIANMPWLVSEGNANGYATKYLSDNGGSLLDYLWLASGSCESSVNCALPSGTHNFNCSGNDCLYPGTSTVDPITDDNIFREMNNAGISWKVYAQSYAAAGGTPSTPDNHNGTDYYRRHNGATWYSDILDNVDGSAAKIVDLSEFAIDLQNGTLPRFMIIVPDGNHDAHDCPPGIAGCTQAQQLAGADTFLKETLQPLLGTPDFQPGGDGLVLITFDECGGGTDAGCGAAVYTALIGPRIKPHTVSATPYKHENALRTMLDSLGIKTYPGASATAADMSDFFTTATASAKPVVVVGSPGAGSTLSSPVSLNASASATSGHSIVGWWVYVDSVGVYNAGAAASIAPSIKMGLGNHTVVVRAWDSSGAYGDQSFGITVAAGKPAVAILTPANNAAVGSPLNLQASATPASGRSIVGWWVYADSVGVYNAGSTNSIVRNLPLSVGKHTIVVRAWDSAGAYGDQTLTVNVGTKPAIAILSPTIGSNMNSPINIRAAATPSSGRTIVGWWVYVDSVGSYNAGAVSSITASLPASTGTHTIVVRAWDSTGAYGDQTFSVGVTPTVGVSAPAQGSPVLTPGRTSM